jgi:hypothetical protein
MYAIHKPAHSIDRNQSAVRADIPVDLRLIKEFSRRLTASYRIQLLLHLEENGRRQRMNRSDIENDCVANSLIYNTAYKCALLTSQPDHSGNRSHVTGDHQPESQHIATGTSSKV